MAKVLFIGDPHFQTENIPEVSLFIEKLEELANKEKPDIICVGGDVLHTHERLHTIPLNKAYEFIDRLRRITKTFVLVGNHDLCNNQQFLTENHWMNAMKEWTDVTIVDKVVIHVEKGIKMVFCPYVPPGRFEEALNTEKWKDCDCIFAHQEFQGCKMGAIESVDGDKWPLDFPNVVSGHIHSNQTPQENVYYPGSAMQHAFGESEKNIIAVLAFKKKKEKYNLVEHDLNLPRKKIIYTDISDINKVIEKQEEKESTDKIKISVKGTYEEFKAFKKTKQYKEAIKKNIKIVYKSSKIRCEENIDLDTNDFTDILRALILNEKDPYLFQVYEKVIFDRNISIEDVFFAETVKK